MNIVVTGSSSGIGRALVLRLLASGHAVCGLARRAQDDLIGTWPGKFHGAVCDVADWDQMEGAAAALARLWPHADGLVACAAIHGEVGRTVTSDPRAWGATIRADLDGTYHAIRAFHPLLSRAPGRAKVVCFSGGGATKARPNFSAYGAAKTAIVRLVETIAEEERGAPLDINSVAPGTVTTRLTEEILALGPETAGRDEYETARRQTESGSGAPDKAIALVEWLLSPRSDGISGRLISAPWDPWADLGRHAGELAGSDIYTLRRILPRERGKAWGG